MAPMFFSFIISGRIIEKTQWPQWQKGVQVSLFCCGSDLLNSIVFSLSHSVTSAHRSKPETKIRIVMTSVKNFIKANILRI